MNPAMLKGIGDMLSKIPDSWLVTLDNRLKDPTPLTFPFAALQPLREHVKEALEVFMQIEAAVKAFVALFPDSTAKPLV